MSNLSTAAIHVIPVDADWRELLGEDYDGYRVYESAECDCGATVVVHGHGEERHCDLVTEITVELPKTGETFACPSCRQEFVAEVIEGKLASGEGNDSDAERWADSVVCPHCEEVFEGGDEVENTCDASLYSEGPMMNYYYPLPHFSGDVEELAKTLPGPLCLVEFESGEYALALTGGGMDLTWEICAAYIHCGYLPPLHFCDLPRMADKHRHSHWRPVIEACLNTLKVIETRVSSRASDLAKLYDELDSAST